MDVGANHNGNLETAKELIISAAEMGANAIKFQTYTADNLYSTKTPKFSKDPMSPYDMIKIYQHPRDWLPILNQVAKEHNICFTSTPFDLEAVDQLEEIDVPFYKISSPELVDLELIGYIAKKKKPIIISTGMANLGEIEEAINIILENNNKNVILLQCTTLYPTPLEAVNLRAMKTLKKSFNQIVGFSDHTLDIHISLAAVAMGARVLEKHFTLNTKQEGPDHNFALEPLQLKELVEKIRDIEKSMGNGLKEPHKLELKENYEKARRSIIAAEDIKKGTKITRNMLIVKRPGYGIKPKFINLLVGRIAKIDIENNQWITWEMV